MEWFSLVAYVLFPCNYRFCCGNMVGGECCGMDIFSITSSKQEIISLLGNIDREGMGNVITYMVRSDYFIAHCHHHHRYKGGLVDHLFGVYYEMIDMAPHLSDESCRIVAFPTIYAPHI